MNDCLNVENSIESQMHVKVMKQLSVLQQKLENFTSLNSSDHAEAVSFPAQNGGESHPNRLRAAVQGHQVFYLC